MIEARDFLLWCFMVAYSLQPQLLFHLLLPYPSGTCVVTSVSSFLFIVFVKCMYEMTTPIVRSPYGFALENLHRQGLNLG